MFKSLLAGLALLATATGSAVSITPTVTNSSFSFGEHYAVLNLDLINDIVGTANTTAAGATWINNTATWIDTVHKQSPPPLSIFTRIYFSNVLRPEIGPDTPFGQAVATLGNLTASSPGAQLYPAFKPLDNWDVVLQKARYYAGAGNPLEEILSSQKIDTVVLSGARTSGVILSTAIRLFDLNYNVYVISNNTFETASTYSTQNQKIILEGILPLLPVNIITIEQAIDALSRSGPAVY